MKKSRKTVSIALGVVVVLLLCTFLSSTIRMALLPEVTTVELAGGRLSVAVTTEGTVRLGEERTAYSPLAMEIQDVLVKEGQTLRAGDSVLKVDTGKLETRRKELELAVTRLREDPDIWYSASQREELRLQREIAQMELDAFLSSLPENGEIKAEVSGEVLSVEAAPYQAVEAGAPLYTCYTSENVHPAIEFALSDAQAQNYQAGHMAEVSFEQVKKVNGEEVSSEVTEELPISRKLYGNDGTIKFEIALDDDAGFTDGEKVKLRLVSSNENYRLLLPVTAVFEQSEQKKVAYLVKTRDGLFGEESYLQEVELKELARNSEYVAVESEELLEGMEVVAFAQGFSLQNGQTVKVKG